MNNTQIKRTPQPAIWIFLRLIIPTGPIILQYSLFGLGATKEPEFPQITYIILLFGLSLATVTELDDLKNIIYLSFLPSILATFLLTVVYLKQDEQEVITQTLFVGFIVWVALVIINTVRIIQQFKTSRT